MARKAEEYSDGVGGLRGLLNGSPILGGAVRRSRNLSLV